MGQKNYNKQKINENIMIQSKIIISTYTLINKLINYNKIPNLLLS